MLEIHQKMRVIWYECKKSLATLITLRFFKLLVLSYLIDFSNIFFFCSFRSATVKYRDSVFPTIKVTTHPRRDRKEGVSCETKFLNVKTILY